MSTRGHGPWRSPPSRPLSSSTLAPSPLCPRRTSAHTPRPGSKFQSLPIILEENLKGLRLANKGPHDSGSFLNPTWGHFSLKLLIPASGSLFMSSDRPFVGSPWGLSVLGLLSGHHMAAAFHYSGLDRELAFSQETPALCILWLRQSSPTHITLPHCTCSFPPSHVTPTALIYLFYAYLMNVSHLQQRESSRGAKPMPTFIHSWPHGTW